MVLFQYEMQIGSSGICTLIAVSISYDHNHYTTNAYCPGYDIKLSDGEAPALEFGGMWLTPSLPLFLGPLWSGVVASDLALSIGQIE